MDASHDTQLAPAGSSGQQGTTLQQYLDKAVGTLETFGSSLVAEKEESQLVELLQTAVSVNEPKVLAIAKVVHYKGAFERLVRDNVDEVHVGERFTKIAENFNSITGDMENMIHQLDDGKLDAGEKFHNFVVHLQRGTIPKRFDKISTDYLAVQKDAKNAKNKLDAILNAYMDFRNAYKHAEILAQEVLVEQNVLFEAAKKRFIDAQQAVNTAEGDAVKKSRLELARDEVGRAYKTEEKVNSLLFKVATNLSVGYDLGEAVAQKIQQNVDVIYELYTTAITWHDTNSQNITLFAADHAGKRTVHEQTQAIEAMKAGIKKTMETSATYGNEILKKGLETAGAPMISVEAMKVFYDSILQFQKDQMEISTRQRKANIEATAAIRDLSNNAKKEYVSMVADYLAKDTAAAQPNATQILPQ